MPINLGQITFGIGADTTQLRQSINDITNFGAAVTSAATSANTAGTAIEASFRRQEAAMISALQKVQRFQDGVNQLRAPQQLTQGFNQLSTRALDQLTARMSSGQLTALQYQREMERFNVTMSNASRIMNSYAAAMKQAEASSMTASLQKLTGAAILVAGPLSGIATRISVIAGLAEHFSLAWAGAIAGVAAGAYTFYKLSTAIITVEKSLQNIEQTLTAVYGNATIANLQFKYLSELSDRTGASFTTLAKQYSQVEAAAKGTSLEGERVQKLFEQIAFAGAKLGLSNEELEGTFKAIQQMMSKGTIQMEELKGQLGDRLPGAVKIMADALEVSVQKLNKMIKAGEVGSSALVKFGNELVKRYNIDTSKNIDTITAAEGRLGNARVRLLDTMDKILGVSQAYVNSLNYITGGLSGATEASKKLVAIVAATAAAFAGFFVSTAIVSGISMIIGGIVSLTAAIRSLNVAMTVGGAATLLGLLARLGIALAAGYATFKLTEQAIEGVKESYLTTTPAVEAYIKAQQKLVTSVRQPTLDYIKQQEELLATLEKQKAALSEGTGPVRIGAEWDASKLSRSPTEGLDKKLEASNNAINTVKANLKALNDILKRQTAEENKNRADPEKELTNRQTVAMEKAKETIKDTKAAYDRLFLAPGAKDFAEVQDDINHKIESFKENLERAEIPAATLKKLVKDYGDEIRKLKEGELILKTHTSAFQAMAGVFGRGMETGLTNFIDVLVDGKDKMVALADTARAVAKDILNTFLKLAALNPLKNALFGTNDPVLGGTAGTGGIFGGLIKGGGSSINSFLSGDTRPNVPFGREAFEGPGFALGGIMGPNGRVPLRRYSGGGVARSAQMAMFGEGSMPEAYVPLPDGHRIPVNMSGGGGGGMEVHIHNPPGHQAEQTKSAGSSGGVRLDVMFKKMFNEAAMGDIAQSGPMSRTMERQFGLNRAKGLSS